MGSIRENTVSGPLGEQDLRLTLGELRKRLHDFPTEFLKGKSKETVGTYRRSLNGFERWFIQQGGGCRFRPEDFHDYKDYLERERKLSQVSVSTYLTAVRQFCQYLVSIGLITENPAAHVKGNRRPMSHSRQVLTESDIDAFLQVIDVETLLGKRDMAVIYLMLYAGLSEIEIVRADVGDLEHTLLGTELRVQGKGRKIKDQAVPIDFKVMDTIDAYLDARPPRRTADALFVSHGHRSNGERLKTRSLRGRISAHLEAAGIRRTGISPHSLTHTAPLLWLNAGMDLKEVQSRMRHGTIDTTMIHQRKKGLVNLDQEDLEAMQAAAYPIR